MPSAGAGCAPLECPLMMSCLAQCAVYIMCTTKPKKMSVVTHREMVAHIKNRSLSSTQSCVHSTSSSSKSPVTSVLYMYQAWTCSGVGRREDV